MSIKSKSCIFALSLLTVFGAYNSQINFGIEKANAAQTQIERQYIYGYNVKTLKKRNGPKIKKSDVVQELIDWAIRLTKDDNTPSTPATTKFVSSDAAGVSWEDASRACDQMKGKLVWYENKKTCF